MELESLLCGAAASRGAQAGRSSRSSKDGVCGLGAGCSTPWAEQRHRPCSPKSWGCRIHPTKGMRTNGSLGKEQPPLTRGLAELGSRACPSLCRPTGQGASAQPVPLLILWERAMEATNLSCLIPHFSQCFKKHPWLTAEEGCFPH